MATNAEPVRVVLELDTSSDPIRGSVLSDSGHRPFEGWMELTAAIEDARLATRDGNASRETPTGRGPGA